MTQKLLMRARLDILERGSTLSGIRMVASVQFFDRRKVVNLKKDRQTHDISENSAAEGQVQGAFPTARSQKGAQRTSRM
jgi:hypothetical protein